MTMTMTMSEGCYKGAVIETPELSESLVAKQDL